MTASGIGKRQKSFLDSVEETFIALLLAAMTLITFANVIVRKSADVARPIYETFGATLPSWWPSNILWALEATVFLFAWLVLMGASYAVKHTAHLGVDVVIDAVPAKVRRTLGFISIAACLLFAFFMVKAAWDYWAVFADLPPTDGRWFPLGFAEKFRSQSFYETNDIPMLAIFNWLEPLINYGDSYEKLPKVVPYFVMPLSMILLLIRFIQAAIRMVKGEQDRVIVSHEVEDQIDEAAAKLEG